MSFQATVYRILVASPGDVGNEREVIPEVINEWNAVQCVTTKSVVLPVRWETHSAPVLGGRPQAVINEQLVQNCDLLVGLFWTRIGTHTGAAESGTVEEIEHFIKTGKPVMLYFSSAPIDPEKIDLGQYQKLKEFKEKMKPLGLIEGYTNTQDFREKFARHLAIHLNGITSGQSIVPHQPPATKAEIVNLTKQNTIHIEDYEKDGKVRSFIVKGDTTKIKDKLMAAGGKWRPTMGGWLFPKSKEIEVASIIKTTSA